MVTNVREMRKRENRGYGWNQESEVNPQKKLDKFLEKNK